MQNSIVFFMAGKLQSFLRLKAPSIHWKILVTPSLCRQLEIPLHHLKNIEHSMITLLCLLYLAEVIPSDAGSASRGIVEDLAHHSRAHHNGKAITH
jgi:hypothetical protein